jgi:hypothetical protein
MNRASLLLRISRRIEEYTVCDDVLPAGLIQWFLTCILNHRHAVRWLLGFDQEADGGIDLAEPFASLPSAGVAFFISARDVSCLRLLFQQPASRPHDSHPFFPLVLRFGLTSRPSRCQ